VGPIPLQSDMLFECVEKINHLGRLTLRVVSNFDSVKHVVGVTLEDPAPEYHNKNSG